MSLKTRWFVGVAVLIAVVGALSLLAWGGPLRASPGLQAGGIDLQHYVALKARVDDLRAQGQEVAHLDAIVADIEFWIAQDRVEEANLRIKDLEVALDNLAQESPPAYEDEGTLPPAPSYQPIPQAGGELLFAEDFSGEGVLAAWEDRFLRFDPGNMATWQQRQEALFLNMGAGGMQIVGMVAVAGEAAWTDIVYNVDLFPVGNLEVGAVFRYQDEGFYRFRLLSHERGVEGTRLLERVTEDEVVVLDRSDGPGYQPGRWYNVQIAAAGPQIAVYLDGQPVLEATDDVLTNGRVGAYALSLGDVYFDNIRVSKVR